MGNHKVLGKPETAKARGKLAPVSMAHIVYKTPKFKEMRDWWCLVLEAKPSMDNGQLAFLTYDDEHHRVAIIAVPALFPNWKFTRGVDHVAYTYDSLTSLLQTWERLKKSGIEPIWAINHGPTTSLYYLDPDKNQVELQVENFQSDQELEAFAVAGDFELNPIGVDFDPADLLQKLRAGVPEEELKKRPVIGERGLTSVPRQSIGNLHKFLITIAGLFGK